MECIDIQASKEVNLKISNNPQPNITNMNLECDQCEYISTTGSNLKRHKKAKHDGVKFPCNKCDYEARYSHNLQQHMVSKHSKLYKKQDF